MHRRLSVQALSVLVPSARPVSGHPPPPAACASGALTDRDLSTGPFETAASWAALSATAASPPGASCRYLGNLRLLFSRLTAGLFCCLTSGSLAIRFTRGPRLTDRRRGRCRRRARRLTGRCRRATLRRLGRCRQEDRSLAERHLQHGASRTGSSRTAASATTVSRSGASCAADSCAADAPTGDSCTAASEIAASRPEASRAAHHGPGPQRLPSHGSVFRAPPPRGWLLPGATDPPGCYPADQRAAWNQLACS